MNPRLLICVLASSVAALAAGCSPRGEVLAEDPTNNEGIIETQIPIAEFRRNRRIPRYPLEVVAPVFAQYRQELPLNHLDLPPGEFPQTGEGMKALLDRLSRWLNPPAARPET